ncbi:MULTISPECIES: hydroxymethylglutaryl-CoA reductase [Chromobacteriaceae]|uniref:Hydroxymethylglutaryl-CoA reductase n=2 Tax=Chromobacteriaceae TaxID=1499392 RepID=A0ABV0CK11_9NEIS|nr:MULTISPECIES: hydroxymethylglutaryl-CoA reductase [Chromobacteriaceae]AVG16790.1 hydroxymethylglutaryl-CoA reductase [Chromobacterium vaccinii]ERE13383.1 hydroxymethylglutaryl-CoA reductase [Pseudogulbenkiania ferrooxidans EGD-HP2]
MKIPRSKEDDYSQEIIAQRHGWLETFTGQHFPYLQGRPYEPGSVLGTCENYVGTVGVPVGLAGPLAIHGSRAQGEFVVPMATTEGALVASFSRGMSIITESGGCHVLSPGNVLPGETGQPYRVLGDALTKVSAVVLRDAAEAGRFDGWLREHLPQIVAAANATSRFAKLLEVSPLFHGDLVGLAFTYSTDQAMGLNMATKANEAACRYILAHSGGLAIDYFNTLGGDKRFVPDQAKGRYVSASVRIPAQLLQQRLRTTAHRMRRFLGACNILLAQRGATAPNIHIANALTAMFIACGQDPAFVTVSFKNASTTFEPQSNGDLLASVTLPNLLLGTVGGGVKLPGQQECLRMLGCEGDVIKLAEIIAAVALAGEVSVAGAVTAGEFTHAHTVLGRGLHGETAERKA